MLTAISAIFVFFLVVVFHELGHFSIAKLVGIKVNEFSIGMGPRLAKLGEGETEYSIRLLPIGGYVKMEGEDGESDDKRSFNNKPVFARIAVLAAGAIMNFVLAIIIFSIILYITGTPTTIISETIDNSPAYEAGIIEGDKIIAINDNKTQSWDAIVNEINKSTKNEIKVTVLRNSKVREFYIKPIIENNRLLIGIVPKTEKSLYWAIKGGMQKTVFIIGLMFEFFKMLFQGNVTSNDIAGPVGIIHLVGEAAKFGFLDVLYITGFISVNLGFFNLLPIPALDGSRILFSFIELFRGKPINPEKEGFIHFVGFIFLIILMILVTYKDFIKFNIF